MVLVTGTGIFTLQKFTSFVKSSGIARTHNVRRRIPTMLRRIIARFNIFLVQLHPLNSEGLKKLGNFSLSKRSN